LIYQTPGFLLKRRTGETPVLPEVNNKLSKVNNKWDRRPACQRFFR